MPARRWLGQFTLIAQRGRQFLGGAATLVGRRNDAAACHRLLRQRGEASSMVLAAEILAHIAGASPAETERFLTMLATEFGPAPDTVARAARVWLDTPTAENLAALAKVVEPPRQELFRRLNMIPGGTSALLGLRPAPLRRVRDRPDLAVVDADLKHLFTSWFNRGFLRLEEITWQTSADILERLTGYEAVHEMRGWRDLRGRLAPDRRCFAFFHPALPREPLIFVEVALVQGLATAMPPLLAPETDEEAARAQAARADTAIFYSISNCQDGLRGISFGNFLIKQ